MDKHDNTKESLRPLYYVLTSLHRFRVQCDIGMLNTMHKGDLNGGGSLIQEQRGTQSYAFESNKSRVGGKKKILNINMNTIKKIKHFQKY